MCAYTVNEELKIGVLLQILDEDSLKGNKNNLEGITGSL